jgi:hypothetical protein
MTAMADNVTDLVLDGNAAACLLQNIFAQDITLAQIRCDACGAVRGVGSLALHAAHMGAVLRCVHCDRTLVRAVRTPNGLWLEMNAGYLRF